MNETNLEQLITGLAEEARMTNQSMGELVAYLERRGYAKRLPDPRDGRAERS